MSASMVAVLASISGPRSLMGVLCLAIGTAPLRAHSFLALLGVHGGHLVGVQPGYAAKTSATGIRTGPVQFPFGHKLFERLFGLVPV